MVCRSLTSRSRSGQSGRRQVSGGFIIAETATADIKDFGTPQGSFTITDTVSVTYDKPAITDVTVSGPTMTVSGQLVDDKANIGFKLLFEAVSPTHLRFVISVDGVNAAAVNRIRLVVASVSDEGIFGFGQQLTHFNQKGFVLPILVQEHGVGRGQPIVTQKVDWFAKSGGGTPYSTECPAPHFVSSRLRSLFLENSEYSEFDMRRPDAIDIKVWAPVMTGRILYGHSPLELIETYTEFCGRMRALPDWVHNGVIVAVQGGTEAVKA